MLAGIDVSSYQGAPNWHAVHESGIVFAGIKATEGLGYHDPQFQRNWQHTKLRGIRRIAYHFFHADLSGQRQADYFHSYVHDSGRFGAGDCAMLDIETTNGVDGAQLAVNAEAFVERFLATTQCGLYIYTSGYFWNSVLGGPQSKILGKCPLWAASWGSRPAPVSNWLGGASIWQWTANLHVPGIIGDVDGDRFLGTVLQYDELAREGGRH